MSSNYKYMTTNFILFHTWVCLKACFSNRMELCNTCLCYVIGARGERQTGEETKVWEGELWVPIQNGTEDLEQGEEDTRTQSHCQYQFLLKLFLSLFTELYQFSLFNFNFKSEKHWLEFPYSAPHFDPQSSKVCFTRTMY